MKQILKFALILLVAVAGVSQAKLKAPVSLESTPPVAVQIGETITTHLQLTPYSALEKMTVRISAYQGLDVVGGGGEVVLYNLQPGDVNELEVTVQMTESYGYLAVFIRTTDTHGKSMGNAEMVRIGTFDEVNTMSQNPGSHRMIERSGEENLFLMPAEVR